MIWLSNAGRELLLTFVPIFVAMDSLGNLPFFLFLTSEVPREKRPGLVRSAMLTGFGLGIGFLLIGKAVFSLLGIQVNDFLLAGGLILIALSLKDIVTGKIFENPSGDAAESVGVVPLGTPLMVGPATLTTLLLLTGQYSWISVVVSFVVNLALTWLVFAQSDRIAGFLGKGGLRATSKIASLLLAAIAIKMIRQGLG